MEDTIEKIRIILSDVMKEELTTLSMETDLTTDLDLDSILFIQFLLALEDEISGLEFNQETLTEVSFKTIGSLVDYIERFTCVKAD